MDTEVAVVVVERRPNKVVMAITALMFLLPLAVARSEAPVAEDMEVQVLTHLFPELLLVQEVLVMMVLVLLELRAQFLLQM
jgi:hypothetical protein